MSESYLNQPHEKIFLGHPASYLFYFYRALGRQLPITVCGPCLPFFSGGDHSQNPGLDGLRGYLVVWLVHHVGLHCCHFGVDCR